MAGFSLSLAGDKKFQRFLRKMGDRAKDLSVPLKQGGAYMLRSIALNFAHQGRPEKWADLAPETWERKLERKHDKILIDSGRLKRSIKFKAGRDNLLIGTNVVYARIQQLGRGHHRRGPKAGRPYLLFHEGDVGRIRNGIVAWLLDQKQPEAAQ